MDEIPELTPGTLAKRKWYELGGIPMTDRIAFLLWFLVYFIGLIFGICIGLGP